VKKRAILVAFLLCTIQTGQAQCVKQDSGSFTCTEYKSDSKTTDTVNPPASLTPKGYRYWQSRDVDDYATQYTPARQYGWVRYYDVDCSDASETTLDSQTNGTWPDMQHIIELNRQMIGVKHYFQPDSYQNGWCKAIAAAFQQQLDAAKKKAEDEAEQQREAAAKSKPVPKVAPKSTHKAYKH
jgi:hypothetical protein